MKKVWAIKREADLASKNHGHKEVISLIKCHSLTKTVDEGASSNILSSWSGVSELLAITLLQNKKFSEGRRALPFSAILLACRHLSFLPKNHVIKTEPKSRKNESSNSDSNWTNGYKPIEILLIYCIVASVTGFHRKCDVTFHNSYNIQELCELCPIFSVFLWNS